MYRAFRIESEKLVKTDEHPCTETSSLGNHIYETIALTDFKNEYEWSDTSWHPDGCVQTGGVVAIIIFGE